VATSIIIFGLLTLSFLLGLTRDIVIASKLGIGIQADIIFVSLILPVLFENIFGVALRDAAIPYLRGRLAVGRAAFRHAAIRVYVVSGMVSIALSALVAIAAPLLLWLLTPGWSAVQRNAAAATFSVGAALIGIQTVLYIQTALLNGEGRFILPNWRTVLMNLAAISALAQGGGALPVVAAIVVVQTAWLVVMHWQVRPYVAGKRQADSDAAAVTFGANFTPLVAAALAQQACVLAERWFASRLEEGTITLLSLAYRLVTIPQTLYAMAILAVVFPLLAQHCQSGARGSASGLAQRALVMALAFTVPASMVLVALPGPIVSILLERGAFTAHDVARTAPLVAAYAAGLPALCAALVWGRVLVAVRAAGTLAAVSLAGMAGTVLLDGLLVSRLGALGLALALTLGTVLQAGLSALAVARHLPGAVDATGLSRWLVAAVVGTAVMHVLAQDAPATVVAISVAASLAGSAAMLWSMGEREVFRRTFWRSLRTS
jgi:putative peptidoglycan lipid II flippase